MFSENAIARYSDCLCTTGETEDNQQVAKQNVSLTSRPLPNRGSKINAQLPKACSPQAPKNAEPMAEKARFGTKLRVPGTARGSRCHGDRPGGPEKRNLHAEGPEITARLAGCRLASLERQRQQEITKR